MLVFEKDDKVEHILVMGKSLAVNNLFAEFFLFFW